MPPLPPQTTTYYLPPSQPLQPPPSYTTWPPPPPPTTTSDPTTVETWGPVFYESKSRHPRGEKERKVKNGYLQPLSTTSSDSEPDTDSDNGKEKKEDAKTNKKNPPKTCKPNFYTPKPQIELSGQEQRHTTETIEHIPASQGGGIRKTYITTIKLTTVRTERPVAEKKEENSATIKERQNSTEDKKKKKDKPKKGKKDNRPPPNETPQQEAHRIRQHFLRNDITTQHGDLWNTVTGDLWRDGEKIFDGGRGVKVGGGELEAVAELGGVWVSVAGG